MLHPRPRVTFLCSRKEKSPKESAPPGLRPQTSRVPSRRVRLSGCADATSLSRRRTLAIPRSALRGPALRLHAALGLPKGVLKTPLRGRFGWIAPSPIGARLAPTGIRKKLTSEFSGARQRVRWNEWLAIQLLALRLRLTGKQGKTLLQSARRE